MHAGISNYSMREVEEYSCSDTFFGILIIYDYMTFHHTNAHKRANQHLLCHILDL